MSRDITLGLVRHILTIAGGFFVARGSIDAASAEVAIGAITALGGVAWSIVDKFFRRH